jgi:hypothetical protein
MPTSLPMRARRRLELTSAAARGEEMRAAVRDEARSGFSEGANSLPGRKSTLTRWTYTHVCLLPTSAAHLSLSLFWPRLPTLSEQKACHTKGS